MYNKRLRRRKVWPTVDKNENDTMCPKLLSTPIVLTTRLEEMDLFQGNNEDFMNKINKMQNVQGWSVKDIVDKIQNDSKLNIIDIEEKNFSYNNVTNIKQYESLARKVNFLNVSTFSKQKLNGKLFKFNVLYKKTVEFYCISNNATITEYVSLKSIPTNSNIKRYEECHFVETLCCWLKRNYVVENFRKSCEIDELVANFMRQFHLCNPICLCCKDCIQISKGNPIGFPVDSINDDDLSLVTLKQMKLIQINQHIDLNRKYSTLLDSKPNFDKITSRTPYPDIDLLNKTHDKNGLLDKAVRLKELLKKRTVLTNACNVILHKANNVIKMAENINNLSNLIIELHYSDRNNLEITEIIQLGDKGKIVTHVRKCGDNDTKNLGYAINSNNKTIVKIRLCCVPEKNKAFLRLQDKNMSPLSFLYLDTLYNHFIKKRQYYDNFCNWSSEKQRIHFNNDIQLGGAGVQTLSAATSNKSASIDLCSEENNDNILSMDYKTSTITNSVITSQNSSLTTPNAATSNKIVSIDLCSEDNNDNDLSMDNKTSTTTHPVRTSQNSSLTTPNAATSNKIVSIDLCSEDNNDNVLSKEKKTFTTKYPFRTSQNSSLTTLKQVSQPPTGNKDVRIIPTPKLGSMSSNIIMGRKQQKIASKDSLKRPAEQSGTNILTQTENFGSISMQNIITNTIKSKFDDPMKNNLIREINILTDNLRPRFLQLSTQLDSNRRVTASIKSRSAITNDEINMLQMIIYKTQKLVDLNFITSNESLNHVLSSLTTSNDLEEVDSNQTNDDNLPILITKTFTLKNSELDAVYPEQRTVESVTTTHIATSSKTKDSTFHDYSSDIKNPTFTKISSVNNDKLAPEKVGTQPDKNVINQLSNTREPVVIINNPTKKKTPENHTFHQYNSDGTKINQSTTSLVNNYETVTNYTEKIQNLLINKNLQQNADPVCINNIIAMIEEQKTIVSDIQIQRNEKVQNQNSSNDDKNPNRKMTPRVYPSVSTDTIIRNTRHTYLSHSAVVQQPNRTYSRQPAPNLSNDNMSSLPNIPNITNNMNKTLVQPTLQEMPQLVPIENKSNDSAVLYPISSAAPTLNTNLNSSGIPTQNLMYVPMTGLTATNAQNSLGNNQFLIANCSDSIMRVVAPQSYSVPTPSSALTYAIIPGTVPQVQAQPYFIINPIQDNPISNAAIDNLLLLPPHNNVSYKIDGTPDCPPQNNVSFKINGTPDCPPQNNVSFKINGTPDCPPQNNVSYKIDGTPDCPPQNNVSYKIDGTPDCPPQNNVSYKIDGTPDCPPQNNVSYKIDGIPGLAEVVQPQTNVESQTNEMAETITMWSKAPKSKKIIRTEIKTVNPSPLASVGKRKVDFFDNDKILDFYGEVKKIRITKPT